MHLHDVEAPKVLGLFLILEEELLLYRHFSSEDGEGIDDVQGAIRCWRCHGREALMASCCALA